jgi:hypothetical protein
MSWSRPRYDDCTYKHRLAETISPGEYMTQTPRSCDNCVYYAPGVIFDKKGATISDKELIDIDSELLGITRKYSQCPADKYIPGEPFCNMDSSTMKECYKLTPEPTLYSNPKCTNKEVTVNRWEWLCQNPQNKALMPFDMMINNRLIVKDNHRPHLERPLDQEEALPPSCNSKIKYDWSSKYQNTPIYPSSMQLMPCENIAKL